MVDHLAKILDNFPSSPNQTHWFAHMLNLIAKCIMRQFNALKKKKERDNGWDEAFDALDALANELENNTKNEENDANNKEREVEDGEVEKGTFNGQEGMTAEEVQDLEKTVKPVQRVLVKVWCLLIIIKFIYLFL
jgi:hypothetical protein